MPEVTALVQDPRTDRSPSVAADMAYEDYLRKQQSLLVKSPTRIISSDPPEYPLKSYGNIAEATLRYIGNVGNDALTFFKNLARMFVYSAEYYTKGDFAKDISYISRNVAKHLSDPDGPEFFSKAATEFGSDLFRTVTFGYRDAKGNLSWEATLRYMYEQPVHFVADIGTLAFLGTGMVSKSQALLRGQIGNLQRQLAVRGVKNPAQLQAAVASAESKMAKLQAIKEPLNKIQMFPLNMAAWTVSKSSSLLLDASVNIVTRAIHAADPRVPVVAHATQSLLRGLSLDAQGRKFGRVYGQNSLEANRQAELEIRALMRGGRKMTDAEVADSFLISAGAKVPTPEELAAMSPDYKLFLKEEAASTGIFEDWAIRQRLPFATGRASPELFHQAKVNHLAAVLGGLEDGDLVKYLEKLESGDKVKITPELRAEASLVLAENEIKAAALGPEFEGIYKKLFVNWHTTRADLEMSEYLNLLMNPAQQASKRKFDIINRFTGQSPITLDTRVLVLRSVREKWRLRAITNSIRRLVEEDGIPIRTKKDIPPGWGVVLDPNTIGKFHDLENLANGLAIQLIGDALAKHGVDLAAMDRYVNQIPLRQMKKGDFVEYMKQAGILEKVMVEVNRRFGYRFLDTARDVKSWLEKSRLIAIPPGAYNAIRMLVKRPGWITYLYDSAMNYWRNIILLWNPAYYVGNFWGNAVLRMVYGFSDAMFSMKRGLHRVDPADLPAEAANISIASETKDYLQLVHNTPTWLARLKELQSIGVEWSDISPRKDLVTAEVRRALREKQLVDGFLVKSGRTLEQATTDAFRARRELNRLLSELTAEGIVDQRYIRKIAAEFEATRMKHLADQGLVKTRAELDRMVASLYRKNRKYITKGEAADSIRRTFTEQESLGARIKATTKQLHGRAFFKAVQRSAKAREHLEKLRELGELAERGVRTMETILGDYGRNSIFAQKVLRRFFPFWTFARTMFTLSFLLPFLRPGRVFLAHRAIKMMQDLSADDTLKPEWLRESAFIGFTMPEDPEEEPKALFMSLRRLNPAEMTEFVERGRIGIPRLLDFASNPLVAVGIRLSGGRDSFTKAPPPLTPTQFIDGGGRVWDWDPRSGEVRRVTPSTPLFDTLIDLFPQTSWIGDFAAGLGVDLPGRGPKIYRLPDGEIVNQRHWSWALGRVMGFPFTGVDEKTMQAVVKKDLARYIRGMGKKIRYMQPDDLELVRDMFLDIRNAELRKQKMKQLSK